MNFTNHKINSKSTMIFIVLRGLPGSGKTYLTNQIQENFDDVVVISNDLLRINQDDKYNYSIEMNNYIYKNNYKKLLNSLKEKKSFIIIDNCNLNFDMLNNYKKLSSKYNYEYYQIYFQKPSHSELYQKFKRCCHDLSFKKYKMFWKNYYKHPLDVNLEDFNLDIFKR